MAKLNIKKVKFMSIEKSERDRIGNLRADIAKHMEDAAALFQQLPEREHDNYLNTALCAWEDVTHEFLTPEKFQSMIATLTSGEDHLRTKLPNTSPTLVGDNPNEPAAN
jgi:hypothetical protein